MPTLVIIKYLNPKFFVLNKQMIKSYLLGYLTFLLLLFLAKAKNNPDMIVVLSRHGAREPLNSFYDESWTNPTFLMNTGIEQHYTLGNVLAKEYSDLLEEVAPQEIYIQSTYASRTRMSVSAELLGMFHSRSHKHLPNTSRRDFLLPFADKTLLNEVVDEIVDTSAMVPNRLQFIMQKIHSNVEEDLIQITPNNCAYVGVTQSQRLDDDNNKEMEVFLNDTISKLQTLGHDVKSIGQVKEFGDALASRYSDSKPPLEGIPYDGKIFNDTVFGFKWWNIYNLMGDDFERGIKVFPVYNRLVDWFSGKANGTNPLKVALFGGHESSMFPFLNLLNITNHTCFTENYKHELANKPIPYPDCKMPEVASQLIWEFYNNSGKPYVRFLYNGKPFKFCRESTGFECSFEEFIKELPEVTVGMTKEKWSEVCSRKPEVNESHVDTILTISMGFLGILVGLIVYMFLTRKMVFAHQYAKGSMDDSTKSELETPNSLQIQSPKGYSHQIDDPSHHEDI